MNGLLIFLGISWVALGQPAVSAERQGGAASDAGRVRVEVCIDCHRGQYDAIKSTAHWMTGDARTPGSGHECSTCHGDPEEHVLSAGEPDAEGLRTFGTESLMQPLEQNAVCTDCHQEATLLHWQGSGHDLEEVGCVGCHRVHGEDRVRSSQTEQEVCLSCHTALRLQANKPYSHPLREHKMSCGDCHAAHGGPGDADLKTFSINETCYACHAEKRGPFLWEHAPASEDCLLCHSAHGSIHRGMLARRQPHLCQSCHEPTAIANNPAGPHARHSRLALSYREPGLPDLGPEPPPGGRGISRLVMAEACMNCHSKVHGTNHPAGAKLMR